MEYRPEENFFMREDQLERIIALNTVSDLRGVLRGMSCIMIDGKEPDTAGMSEAAKALLEEIRAENADC